MIKFKNRNKDTINSIINEITNIKFNNDDLKTGFTDIVNCVTELTQYVKQHKSSIEELNKRVDNLKRVYSSHRHGWQGKGLPI